MHEKDLVVPRSLEALELDREGDAPVLAIDIHLPDQAVTAEGSIAAIASLDPALEDLPSAEGDP